VSEEIQPFDPEMTEEQKTLASQLSAKQIEEIDSALLASSDKQWRKVAMVVAITMGKLHNRVTGIPDIYYSQRVSTLVEQGKLISQGNLKRMRFSEVKRP